MITFIKGKKATELGLFDSIGELVDVVEKHWEKGVSLRGLDNERYYYSNPDRTNYWHFGSNQTLNTTRELLRNGAATEYLNTLYTNKREEVMGLQEIQELQNTATVIKRKRIFREDGNELNIDRVMAGDPAHWESITKRNNKPVLKLAFNVSASASMTEQTYGTIAAFGAIAADIITMAGYNVEIHAVNITTVHPGGRRQVGFKVKVKGADETLDPQRLLSCGLTGLERFYNFTYCCELITGADGDCGAAILIEPEMRELIDVDYIIDAGWNQNTFAIKIDEILQTLK